MCYPLNLPGRFGVAGSLLFIGVLLAMLPFGGAPPVLKALIGCTMVSGGGHLAAAVPACWQAAAVLALWGACCLVGTAITSNATSAAYFAYCTAGVGVFSGACMVVGYPRRVAPPAARLMEPLAGMAAGPRAEPLAGMAAEPVAEPVAEWAHDFNIMKCVLGAAAAHLAGATLAQCVVAWTDELMWYLLGGTLIFGGCFLAAVAPELWQIAAGVALWGGTCAAAAAQAAPAWAVREALIMCVIGSALANILCWVVVACVWGTRPEAANYL